MGPTVETSAGLTQGEHRGLQNAIMLDRANMNCSCLRPQCISGCQRLADLNDPCSVSATPLQAAPAPGRRVELLVVVQQQILEFAAEPVDGFQVAIFKRVEQRGRALAAACGKL